MTQVIEFHVNGRPVRIDVAPEASLLSVLRDELGLRGTRFGCGMGACGSCSVRIDDRVVPSCDTPMWSVGGRAVVTVEGLSNGSAPHPVQQAILDEQAAQCGFCISGIAVSAAALLTREPRPDEATVVAALERNLCRCGVQRRVVAAVVRAGQEGVTVDEAS